MFWTAGEYTLILWVCFVKSEINPNPTGETEGGGVRSSEINMLTLHLLLKMEVERESACGEMTVVLVLLTLNSILVSGT